MKSGTVKWFNNSKGYGFIRPDEGGEDLFVHYSYIEMEGYKTLKAGQAVNYQVTQADKGLHATHIVTQDDTGSGDTKQPQPNQTVQSQQSPSETDSTESGDHAAEGSGEDKS